MSDDRMGQLERAAAEMIPGGKLLAAEPIFGGISATTFRMDVSRADGHVRTFVARWPGPESRNYHPDAAAAEYTALQLVAEAGLPAPKPRYVSEPGPVSFYVMDFALGAVDVSPRDPHRFVRLMAQQLVTIQAVDIFASKWEAIPAFPPYGSPRTNPPNPDLPEAEVRFALERADLPPLVDPVLRHGDFWPGNVLWLEEEISAVIDWETVSRGQPLFDLAISRLDILWILGPEAMEEFTALYLEMSGRDCGHLRFWDLRAALRPMANLGDWAAPYALWGRPDITNQSLKRDLVWFCEQALSAST